MEKDTRPSLLALFSAILWCFALFCALIPFPAFEFSFFFLSVAFLLSATITADAIGLYKGTWDLPKSPILLIGLAFWGLALASIFWSEIPFVSFVYFWFFSLLPLSFLSFILGHAAKKRLEYARTGLLIILTGVASYGLLQFFFLPDFLFKGLICAPLKNPNSLAALLSSGLFLSIGALFMSGKRHAFSKHFIFLCALLILCALILTGSRGVLLLTTIAFTLICLWLPVQVKKHSTILGALIAFGVLFSFLISGFDPAGDGSPVKDYGQAFTTPETLYAERLQIWSATLDMIKDHLWTGTGIGTFFLYYPAYRPLEDSTAGFMAHNDVLQFWAEMGIVAPILFCVFVLWSIIRTFRALNCTEKDSADRIQLIIPFCALSVLIVHSTISFNFHVVSVLCVMGFLLALWFVTSAALLNERTITLSKPGWMTIPNGWLCFLLPTLCLLTLLGSALNSDFYIKKARTALSEGDMKTFATAVETADKRAFGLNSKTYTLAASIPMGILETKGQTLPIPEQKKLYHQITTLLDKAYRTNPRSAAIFYHRAQLYDMVAPSVIPETAPSQAALLNTALKLDQLHLPSRERLAALYMAKGEQRKALDLLLEGLGWPYTAHDPLSYYRMTEYLMKRENDFTKQNLLQNKIKAYKRRAISVKP